jgi:hypothetical protein
MTPKEKADELIEKYLKLDIDIGDQYDGYITMKIHDAKQCALIAVEEILSNDFLEPQPKRHIGNVPPSKIHLEYWFQVKIELDNL